MNYNLVFKSDKMNLTPDLQTFADELTDYFGSGKHFQTEEEYNSILKEVTEIIKDSSFTFQADSFDSELALIEKGKPLSEKTAWGGVNLKEVNVNKDFIRKNLVIKKLGILGFEIHNEKLENIEVKEGIALIIYSNHADMNQGDVIIELATAGQKFTFQPKDEHGMIAATNAIVEEQSTNHLDDLVFIFNSTQVI